MKVARIQSNAAVEDVLVPPLNFAMVASGVYRSGYPNRKNFPFLRKLGLRSILYLAMEDYSEDNEEFFKAEKIQVFVHKLQGNKVRCGQHLTLDWANGCFPGAFYRDTAGRHSRHVGQGP